MEKHITIRTVAGFFCFMVIMLGIIAGAVYAGHQNNIKDRRLTTECLAAGGETKYSNNMLVCEN